MKIKNKKIKKTTEVSLDSGDYRASGAALAHLFRFFVGSFTGGEQVRPRIPFPSCCAKSSIQTPNVCHLYWDLTQCPPLLHGRGEPSARKQPARLILVGERRP